MATLATSLHKEHQKLDERLRLLEREIATLKKGGSPDYELINLLVQQLTGFPAEFHHQKEDLLYKLLAAKEGAAVERLPDLQEEHRKLSKRIEAFAKIMENVRLDQEIAIDAIAEASALYIREQQEHMNMEEDRFLPLAHETLSDDDWAQLNEEIGTIKKNEEVSKKLAQADVLEEELRVQMSNNPSVSK